MNANPPDGARQGRHSSALRTPRLPLPSIYDSSDHEINSELVANRRWDPERPPGISSQFVPPLPTPPAYAASFHADEDSDVALDVTGNPTTNHPPNPPKAGKEKEEEKKKKEEEKKKKEEEKKKKKKEEEKKEEEKKTGPGTGEPECAPNPRCTHTTRPPTPKCDGGTKLPPKVNPPEVGPPPPAEPPGCDIKGKHTTIVPCGAIWIEFTTKPCRVDTQWKTCKPCNLT